MQVSVRVSCGLAETNISLSMYSKQTKVGVGFTDGGDNNQCPSSCRKYNGQGIYHRVGKNPGKTSFTQPNG